MLAMVAVGLWAGLNGGRALWAWPVAFVGVMVLGGALGIAGIAVPHGGSRHSRLGGRARPAGAGGGALPVAVGAVLVAVFALLHGHAHGAELAGDAAAVTYAAGFAIATALLHAIGLGVAHVACSASGRLLGARRGCAGGGRRRRSGASS